MVRLFCCQNHNLTFVVEIKDAVSSTLKRRGTIWLVVSTQLKSLDL